MGYMHSKEKILLKNTVDWTGIAAGGSIAVIPVIILFVLMQKHFVEGIAGAVKS